MATDDYVPPSRRLGYPGLPATSREERRQLQRDNAKLPLTLQEIPRSSWPDPNSPQISVWRSRHFLVQVFPANPPAVARLSINRTTMGTAGVRWQDGIAWEEMQRLKKECGYGDMDAVEVFPAEADVVNAANMRHLWVLQEKLPFAWRNVDAAF